MDVRKEIIAIIGDYVEIDAENFDTSASFKFAVGLDSFALMSLVGAIEEHFEISIPNEKLHTFKTVDDLIACVEGYVQK